MFNLNPKRQIFVLVVLISIVLAVAIFYYIFFGRVNNKVPARGYFVNYSVRQMAE